MIKFLVFTVDGRRHFQEIDVTYSDVGFIDLPTLEECFKMHYTNKWQVEALVDVVDFFIANNRHIQAIKFVKLMCCLDLLTAKRIVDIHRYGAPRS